LANLRFGRLGEMRDHCSVDRIGLGPFAERVGKSPHLRRIDDHHRQTSSGNACCNTVSKPPVASIATSLGDIVFSLSTNSSIPAPVRLTEKLSPFGRTATYSRSFDTSMPTKIASI
jgi:hypothetical protein